MEIALFGMRQRMVPFSAGTYVEQNGSLSFYYFFYYGIIFNSMRLAYMRAAYVSGLCNLTL